MNKKYGESARLSVYSNYYIERYIMIDNNMNQNEKDLFIKRINKRLDYLIQEINANVTGRTLPFIRIREVYREDQEFRIIINDFDDTNSFEAYSVLNPEEVSLLINFRELESQRIITVCDEFIPGDAKMLIDNESQIAAAVDIFLDISMFHSYSFLDKFAVKEKKEFNVLKLKNFTDNELKSFYYIDKNNLPAFLSFAFAARKGYNDNDFDIYDYCKYWDNFIRQYFGNMHHIMDKPEKQVALHNQIGMLDSRYTSREYWAKMDHGDYLLLRINREPNTNEEKEQLAQYFKIPKFHCGATKVVPISEFFTPYLRKQIREHYVSVIKIVV